MGVRAARYAVVGRPITHSLSPVMQQAAFHALGIHATYEAIDAGVDEAPELFARLRDAGYAGWNVTTPLKDAAFSLVQVTTDDANAARSVNTVRLAADHSLEGDNTDGRGLISALEELWVWQPQSATVLVLGTGPAARAALVQLRAAGADVFCWSRDAQRAARLAPPIARTAGLVVCALAPDAELPDYLLAAADDDTMIFDCNYARSRSPVTRMRGKRRSDGLPLLLHQGALSFEWWTNKPAPLEVMRQAIQTHRGASS